MGGVIIAETNNEWERGRVKTHFAILEKLGRKGLDTHYGEAFETT